MPDPVILSVLGSVLGGALGAVPARGAPGAVDLAGAVGQALAALVAQHRLVGVIDFGVGAGGIEEQQVELDVQQ